jgi:hypothetical protein
MTPINLHRLTIRLIRVIRGHEVSSFQGVVIDDMNDSSQNVA